MNLLNKNSYIVQYCLKFACINEGPINKPPEIIRIIVVFISTFACIITVDSVFQYSKCFMQRDTPDIPSWAAAMVMTCNALESPFGQPFNLYFGSMLATLIGVGMTKIWLTNPDNEDTLWLCGALVASLASVISSYLRVVHPAAISSAFMSVMNKSVRELGWFFLVVQLISGALIIVLSAIFGNLYSQYPLYWLLPPKLSNEEKDSAAEVRSNKNNNHGDTLLSTNIQPTDVCQSQTLQHEISNDASENSYNSQSSSYTESIQPYREPIYLDNTQSHIFHSTDSLKKSVSAPPLSQQHFTQKNTLKPIHSLNSYDNISPKSGRSLYDLFLKNSVRASNSLYLQKNFLRPLTTSIKSRQKLKRKFPGLDFNKTVILTTDDYSFPSYVNISYLDRDILRNIQRKLKNLKINKSEGSV